MSGVSSSPTTSLGINSVENSPIALLDGGLLDYARSDPVWIVYDVRDPSLYLPLRFSLCILHSPYAFFSGPGSPPHSPCPVIESTFRKIFFNRSTSASGNGPRPRLAMFCLR